MAGSNWLLIDKKVLPEVFISVSKAKAFLQSGEAENASKAAKMAGISRSAFYKYKDYVFSYHPENKGRIVTINALLKDTSGVLSGLISSLYEFGANILTLNQNIPTGGVAPISISIRTDNLSVVLEELITGLRSLPGVKSITEVKE